MEQVHSFPPVVDEWARVLILGSMPGAESRRQQQYYAHPRNHFWPLLFVLFGARAEQAANASYAERLQFAMKRGIALWDVIECCSQKPDGSDDATLKNTKPNDFAALFAAYPQIRHVFFNGAKAYDTFRRQVGFELFPQIAFYKLTSSSPANAIGLPRKRNEWEVVRMKAMEQEPQPAANRLLAVEQELLSELAAWETKPLQRDETLDWERIHMASCGRVGQLIAISRGVNPELAAIACALHDYGRIVTGKQAGHAEAGYEPVKEFLQRLALFSADEIEQLAAAVRAHSSKSIVGTPLEEIVKDADVLDCHLYGQQLPREEQRKRLAQVLKDLNKSC